MTRKEWYKKAIKRGTSGDMVFDILSDWKRNEIWLQTRMAMISSGMLSAFKKLVDEAERVVLAEMDEGVILPHLRRAIDDGKAAIALAEDPIT